MTNVTPSVFLDSNVWFSIVYGSSNCEKIIKAYTDERIIAVISQQVLEESIRNIKEKIPQKLISFQKLFSSNPPVMVPDPESIDNKIKDLVDSKDQSIFTSAILAEVDYFVTGNIKDFQRTKLQKLTKIKIMTPKEAVKVFKL